MKKFNKVFGMLTVMAVSSAISAQTFTNSSALLNGNSYNSGGCVAVTDMDQDGLDDIVVLDQSTNLYVIYQNENGTYQTEFYGNVSGSEQWGMCVGDADNDGHNDVFSGGAYDGVHLFSITSRGSASDENLQQGSMFMQACNMADINNDGWLDAFACHDDGESRIWGNDGAGNLVPADDWINMATVPPSDNSGNYGSVWCDFDNDRDTDLFIAKCRQFVSDPFDPRRLNVLYINDGDANYTEHAMERGLRHYEQSWTVDFADYDNDGDFDCLITTHSATLKLYQNDGTGYFTDVTVGSGLEISGFFLQAKMTDFDNDGFVDLMIAGGIEGLYHNNGNGTFTQVNNAWTDNDGLHSFGIGDLNHDGFQDFYASYGDGYVSPDNDHDDILFLNNGNENHWYGLQLEGTISNRNAVGARVEIHGDWGVQIREVRAGESYGISTSFITHFGLGANTSIDLVVVKWPSGLTTVIENPTIDTYHYLIEQECTPPSANISANGSTELCLGETVTLTADAAESFVWSNGASTSSIEVTESGNYNVVVYDENGCASQSENISVTVAVDGIPEVQISGDLEFCEGNSVDLIAPSSEMYDWSNGQDAQAITVTEAGLYSVTLMGICEEVTSEEIEVVVFDAPVTPVIDDVILNEQGTATFIGASENLIWYASENSNVALGSGSSFTSDFLFETSSFWVEDQMIHGGDIEFGAKFDNEGPGAFHDNSNFYNLFDANENITIRSVKVFADGAGDRTIQLVNNFGAVVTSGVFNIPDGESRVELMFDVPAGFQYGLRTTGSPLLWRNALGTELDFPYAIADFCSVTGTNVTGNNEFNYYYFFYDWEVSNELFACPSERVEIQAIVLGVAELSNVNSLKLYPNPVSDELQISFDLLTPSAISYSLIDATGRIVAAKELRSLQTGNNVERLDVSSIASGVYMLQFVAGSQAATYRVVVE